MPFTHMATATADRPSYDLVLHQDARANWQALPERAQDRLRAILAEAAYTRQPSTHQKITLMKGGHGLFRVRTGDHRAIFDKHLSSLRVLVVGHREDVYSRFDYAKDRANDR